MSLLLVGVVLGIVGRGYQAMNRLKLASYQMSQRMEISAFLQRLSYEVSSAVSVSILSDGFTFQRIDPTLNLTRNETNSRLPWPIPTNVATSDPLNAAYRVRTDYRFDSLSSELRRTAFSRTTTELVNVGEFDVTLEQGGRILNVSMRPGEMTAATRTRILLPVVQP